ARRADDRVARRRDGGRARRRRDRAAVRARRRGALRVGAAARGAAGRAGARADVARVPRARAYAARRRPRDPAPPRGAGADATAGGGRVILYSALGGGLGHLARARKVLAALGLAATILTASPFAGDARVVGDT